MSISNQLLHKVLKKHLKLENFAGVYPCDELPKNLPCNKYAILNTHPAGLPGEHFVVIKKQRMSSGPNTLLMFDPLGKEFRDYIFLEHGLKDFNVTTSVFMGPSPVQHRDSKFCGVYCAMYIIEKSKRFANTRFKKYDYKNLKKNDDIVVHNMNKALKRYKCSRDIVLAVEME